MGEVNNRYTDLIRLECRSHMSLTFQSDLKLLHSCIWHGKLSIVSRRIFPLLLAPPTEKIWLVRETRSSHTTIHAHTHILIVQLTMLSLKWLQNFGTISEVHLTRKCSEKQQAKSSSNHFCPRTYIIRDTVFQLLVAMDRLSTCTVASSIQTRHSFTKERNTGKTEA